MPHLFEKGKPRPPQAGRRKGTLNKTTVKIREAAQRHGAAALVRLVELSKDLDGRIAVKAIEIILAYGYGKPREHVELTGAESGPLESQVIFYMPFKERQPN
jgi:hypothetical protein